MGPKPGARRLAIVILAVSAVLPPLAAHAAKLKAIYAFNTGPGGANPAGNMVYVQGNLYGTTMDSGVPPGYGGLFKLDPKTGIETQIYLFAGGADGAFPLSGVIAQAGTLYGTTSDDGNGSGTVYDYDIATGTEKTLYSFNRTPDAASSSGGLLYLNGALYGTSEYGGAANNGAVFKVDVATGAETVLHSFRAGNDGARPVAGLTLVNGTLYGATLFGGNRNCHSQTGCGTVFTINPVTGATSVLYRFGGGNDGARPYATLTYLGGTLFGTTSEGGGTACYGGRGCGTAFRLDITSFTETVLHRFTGGSDGDFPAAPLSYVNGTLYGTTWDGGDGGCPRDGGCGTIYTLNPVTGAETVFPLHLNTGQGPTLGLTLHGNTLYGAAGDGGTGCEYCGTVFEFKP